MSFRSIATLSVAALSVAVVPASLAKSSDAKPTPEAKPTPVVVQNPVLPVEVSNADPISVTISKSGSDLFRATGTVNIPAGGTVADACALTHVPAGKRLLLQYVSILMNGSQADFQAVELAKVEVVGVPSSIRYHAAILGQRMPSGRYAASEPITVYADENETVFVLLGLAAPSPAGATVFCDLFGRLVDKT